jgi:hypothetical protein
VSDGTLISTFTIGAYPYFPAYAAPIVTDELLIAPQSTKTLVFGRSDAALLQTILYGGEVAVVDDFLLISTDTQVLAYAGSPAITFYPPRGTFASAPNITVTAADPSATIHYTTDGSAPNLNSPTVANAGSVLMDHTGKLRAITVKASAVSRIIEASYTIGAASAASALAFNSGSTVSGFSDSMANADFDRDGQSDLAEAVAGTNPMNAADVFEITDSRISTADGATLSISWPSKTGRSYRVQRSSDLQTWVDASASLPGTGAILTHRLPAPASGPCFLRVRIE